MYLEKKLQKSLEYLTSLKIEDLTLVNNYVEAECINNVRKFEVLFPAGFTLHFLSVATSFLNNKQLKFKQSLSKYLQKENNNYSYGYFTKKFNKVNIEFLLPDDLDDTSIILSALYKNNLDIDEKFILKIIRLETKVGGPYITWYVNKEKYPTWTDIDPVVNAHLMYLVSLMDIKLPKTHKYLMKCLSENKIKSPYYPSKLFFYFYFAKYLSNVKDEKAKLEVLQKLKKYKFNKLNFLEKILYGLSLNYLGKNLEENMLEEILDMQNVDGSIKEWGFCLDYSHQGKQTYTTNKAVMTALWGELILLEHLKKNKIENDKNDICFDILQTKAKKIVLDELNKTSLLRQLKKDFLKAKILKAIDIPIYIAIDLKKKMSNADVEVITKFCVASYFGWAGYTMIDNIIDKQEFDNDYLAVTYCLRLQHKYLFEILTDEILKAKSMEAFKVTDENYLWESINLRLKKNKLPAKFNYKYIEKRMKAFITLVSFLPYLLKIKDAGNLKDVIYLVIKNTMVIDQLNDDAHDWKDDINKGILTYVNFRILKSSQNVNRYFKVFWKEVMPEISLICKNLYKEAFIKLEQTNLLDSNLAKILLKSYSPILIADKEVKKIENIAKHYSK